MQGVSTTEIVARMLRIGESSESDDSVLNYMHGKMAHLPTTRRLRQFCNTREPTPDDVIVYALRARLPTCLPACVRERAS